MVGMVEVAAAKATRAEVEGWVAWVDRLVGLGEEVASVAAH